jgi:adenylate cyclase
MDALGLIGRNMAALNRVLISEMAEPIRFGVGVHGSPAVVGEIGYAESRVFTMLGESANIATRLESMCKGFGCEAVVSQSVFAMSEYDAGLGAVRDVTVRGRELPIEVRTIDSVIDLCSPAAASPPLPRPRPSRRLDAAL